MPTNDVSADRVSPPDASACLCLSVTASNSVFMRRKCSRHISAMGFSFQIYVTGKTDAKETIEMLEIIRSRLIPGRVLILADAEQRDNVLFDRNMIVKRMKPQKDRATVFICRDYSCSLPISSPNALISELNKKVFTDL